MAGFRAALDSFAAILVLLQMEAGPAFSAASRNKTTLYRFAGGSDGNARGRLDRRSKRKSVRNDGRWRRSMQDQAWLLQGAYSVLYAYKGGVDGANPDGLAVDASGNFYGATAFGGSNIRFFP